MPDLDVAVVGAGIAGLSAAHHLEAAGRSVEVFESEQAVGGRMRTRRQDGYLIDQGAETLGQYGYARTWDLVQAVGIGREEVLRVRAPVGLWRGGRVHPYVGHPFLAGLAGAGLSPRGRVALTRLAAPLVLHARSYDPDAPGASPLGDLTVARLGADQPEEIRDYLLQPAVGTAWNWDPSRSCVAPLVSTMLATRGIWRWRTYRDGMDTLARRVAERLPIHTGSQVCEARQRGGGVALSFANGGTASARAVVLAVPAPLALALHPAMPDDERAYLSVCGYTPMIRTTCLLDRPLQQPSSAGRARVYALLVPAREDAVLSGVTFEHNKAGNRAPPNRGLVSLLTARAAAGQLINRPDDEVVGTMLAVAERILPGLRESCRAAFVHRFPHGAPEATPAALRASAGFLGRPARAVDYAGDWVYQRPSSEAAVRSGLLASARIVSPAR
jgi:protoporphyrinogen/coproporphyrinogen III oxidase